MTSPATPPAAVPTEEERETARELWLMRFDSDNSPDMRKESDLWESEWAPIAQALATARSSAMSAALEEAALLVTGDCCGHILAGKIRALKDSPANAERKAR